LSRRAAQLIDRSISCPSQWRELNQFLVVGESRWPDETSHGVRLNGVGGIESGLVLRNPSSRCLVCGEGRAAVAQRSGGLMEETLRMAQVGCGALGEVRSGPTPGRAPFISSRIFCAGAAATDRGSACASVAGFSRSNHWSAGVASRPAALGLPRPASESTCQQPTEASSSGGLMP
jgi:hypothetical protein